MRQTKTRSWSPKASLTTPYGFESCVAFGIVHLQLVALWHDATGFHFRWLAGATLEVTSSGCNCGIFHYWLIVVPAQLICLLLNSHYGVTGSTRWSWVRVSLF